MPPLKLYCNFFVCISTFIVRFCFKKLFFRSCIKALTSDSTLLYPRHMHEWKNCNFASNDNSHVHNHHWRRRRCCCLLLRYLLFIFKCEFMQENSFLARLDEMKNVFFVFAVCVVVIVNLYSLNNLRVKSIRELFLDVNRMCITW